MGLRIEVEIEKWHFKTGDDEEMVQTRVLVDGRPDLHLTRLWTRDMFHSYFDDVWDYMGVQIKKMAIELEFNKEENDGSL